MANIPYLVDIDLKKNQLLNAVVQNLATAPTAPKEGQIYYNTTDKKMYAFLGTVWVDLSSIYTHPTFTALNPTLTGANVLATFQTNAQGHVTAATTRLLRLKEDLGYTGALNANYYVHPTFSGNDLGAPLTGKRVISDVEVNNQGHVTGFVTRDITATDIGAAVINDSVTNAVNTWSSTKIQAELNAINSAVTGALVYKGGYNAATNTPNLTTGVGVKQGFTYTVTVAGTFYSPGGEALQVGDMIIAEKDTPTTLADWTTVNKNIPDIVDATDEVAGIIRVATQAEVNAGTVGNFAVIPSTLVAFYNTKQAGNRFATNIGNGTATSFDLTHGLATKDVLVQVIEDTSGDEVIVQARRVSETSVRILVNDAPTNNQYRVVIKK